MSPVYPWIPGQWADRPDNEEQVEILSLPKNTDDGWPISGQDCMESIVLLAGDMPLPKTVDIPNLLAGIPTQAMQDPRSLLWFEGGELVVRDLNRHRGPQWFDPKRINDPICGTQRMVFQRLEPYFNLICANSFAVVERRGGQTDASALGISR